MHEFLKPGIEEMCQVLPPLLARPILRSGGAPRLARPRPFRHGDQHDLDRRLSALPDAGQARALRPLRLPLRAGAGADRSVARADRRRGAAVAGLALEIAECARLIKGYGDTHARGLANYRTIEARVIRAGARRATSRSRSAVDAIASARTAALVDPEGESLARCLAEIDSRAAYADRRRIARPSVVPTRLAPRRSQVGIRLRARRLLRSRPSRT